MKQLLIIISAICISLGAFSQNIFYGTSLTKGELPWEYVFLFGGSVKDNVSKQQTFAYLFDKNSVNNGIAGSCLEATPSGSSNKIKSGASLIPAIKKYSGHGKVFVEFGINDILYNQPYSTTGFKKYFTLFIETLLKNEVPSDSIVIIGNYPYMPEAYKFYKEKVKMLVPDKTRVQRYNDVNLSISKKYKTLFFDLVNDIPAFTPDVLLGDKLHPNSKGHAMIYQGLLKKFVNKPTTPIYDTAIIKYPFTYKVTHDTTVIRDSVIIKIKQ